MALGDDSDPPPAERSRPLSFGAAALWTLLAFFAKQMLLEMTSGAGAVRIDLVAITGCEILAYSLVLFAILRVHEPEGSIRHVLAVRRPAVLGIVLAVLIGAALALPSDWLDNLLQSRFPSSPEQKEAFDELVTNTTIRRRITLVVTLMLLQPAFEELFFRGALFTPLRRTQRAEVVVMASAAFETLSYVSPRWMLSLLGPSIVFAWIRATTGSVFPSIAARVAFFGVGVVPLALGRAEPKPTPTFLAVSAGVFVLATPLLALIARRDATTAAARSRDGDDDARR